MEIRSKAEFYRLWKAGALGNRTQVWDRVEDALASGCPMIGFREVGKAGGGAWELAPRDKAFFTAVRWLDAGRKFICDDSVPNDKSVMQGEICRTFRGLESFLVVGNGLPPMRRTIAAGLHRNYGYLATKTIVERYLDPASREDLEALLDLYPDATVELTSFSVSVGNIPNRNTIFWEVRNY